MPSIREILSRPGSDWHAFRPPLSDDAIADATRRIRSPLPASLLDLYRICNGGEGSLPYQPLNFILWGIDKVAVLREDEHYREYYDQLVFFGGNGGGEYFALDSAGRVFYMDPIAGEESIIVVAPSFDEFATRIGSEPPDSFVEISQV